jgi:hypothetical protein
MDLVHIGFTGTRHGMSVPQHAAVDALLSLFDPLWVHHGDCVGADEQFHALARKYRHRVHLHPPVKDDKRAFCDWDKISDPFPYLTRDRHIVAASSLLLATPYEMTKQFRGGTWTTIRYAREANLDRIIILPDGSIYPEEDT